jgi:putative ABC transport system ATP-binding protein
MDELLIETRKLSKSFSQLQVTTEVLKGLDLKIRRGDMLAIEGRSGSGKSTLLSILGLLDNASGGEYLLCGEPVHKLTAYQKAVLRNRHIGWIFQNFNLINDMTVAENIALPLRYHSHIPRRDYKQRVDEVLEQVGLPEKPSQYPPQLSGGQQQRVAIARALVTSPDLLLADEPTGNLDSESSEIIFQLLLELHAKGATVLLVTHDPELAKRCQRRCYMEDGVFLDAQAESVHEKRRVAGV